MLFLGIDIGTTNTKALILDEQLRILAQQSSGYSIHFLENGGVEQSPEDWWNAVCQVIRRFWESGINPRLISGIGVSGHGCALVVTDCQGRILRPAISSLDTRCNPQTEYIRRTSSKIIMEQNGNAVGAFNFEPKLLWLKETEPENYNRMPCFMSPTSYINYRLTGKRTMNISDGGIGMAFDRKSGNETWSTDIIRSMGLDPEKFPPLAACMDVIGTVHAQASRETGLPTDIPVIAGGEDTSSAALAMGITKPGMAYISLGTQGTVGVCTDRFSVRPEILGFPYVLPGMSLLSGSMSTCGGGLQWFVREWCKDLLDKQLRDGGDVYDHLMQLCGRTEPGAKGLLFLPYLSGELHPILDEKARGVFFGLHLEHTREDMARAVMEGSAHAIAHNLLYAEQVSGRINELRATGGPTRSALWCQAIADITARPVQVMGTHGGESGAPLGNALMVMHRVTGRPIEEMVSSCVYVEREYTPRKETKPIYEEAHRKYQELYISIKYLFHS